MYEAHGKGVKGHLKCELYKTPPIEAERYIFHTTYVSSKRFGAAFRDIQSVKF